MVKKFIAHAPGRQDPDTYRQFVEVQQAIQDLEDRIVNDLLLGFIIPNYTFAAHGTMFNQTPVVGPDIGTGWHLVTSFDTIAAERRIAFDTDANSWTYVNAGVYQVSVEMILSHSESNGGRSFQIRLQDGNNTGDGVPVSIGRNQPGSNIAVSFLADIPLGSTDRTFQLQVGNGDHIAGVTWEAVSVTVVNVGAWIDDAPAIAQRALP